MTPEFGEKFWKFVEAGQYRNKATSVGKPKFYRFDKSENEAYPKMIELFARSEYSILFKAKAYLDLSDRKERGENVDSRDIRKHKNDILRITVEFVLEGVSTLPTTVINDMEQFISRLESEPFDIGLLKKYGVSNEDLIDNLRKLYDISIIL